MNKKTNTIDLINKYNIIIFIKGERKQPQCRFSAIVINIFNELNVKYHTINVLKDYSIIKEIKDYSNWPTIPQIYISGQFIGGSDIIKELYKTSRLQEILEIHLSS
uniref:Glutaredoxin n=1 Tax=Pterocladia lucida TaxID=31408 RepID=A0A6M3WVX0_PTELU|nr:hypothetical protein [Pterocladia lucida]